MKKIVVSLMVITLMAGLIGGGLFADFSDIETSHDNYFNTGSMDLKVSDYNGIEYDDPMVPAFLQVSDAWPCCSKDIRFDLHNMGQGFQAVPYVYLHIKNLECYGLPDKNGDPKTEPELAAEQGLTPVGEDIDGNPVYACVDPTMPASITNPALLGEYGENCELSKHVDVAIFTSTTSINGPWTALDLSQYDNNPANGIIKLDELVCHQIELGQVPSCNTLYVMISFHLQDIPEEYFNWNLFDNVYPELKWNDWPTNALQKDGMKFDMAFELLQNRVP
jgi:hypothetical protein